VGDLVRLSIDLDSAVGLRGLPLQLSFDKDVLSLLAVEEGGYFSRDGEKTSFTQTIQAAEGVARAGVLRNGAAPASGKGTVYTLQFKAIKGGTATVAVTGVHAIRQGDGVTVPAPPPLTFTVR
jgi:general secretion pathway protein D